AHLAVDADADHVILLTGRLAVVFEDALALRTIPDVGRLAEAGPHVGLGGDALFQLADRLVVATADEADHGRRQAGQNTAARPIRFVSHVAGPGIRPLPARGRRYTWAELWRPSGTSLKLAVARKTA